jgi:septum site-determining protein MinC
VQDPLPQAAPPRSPIVSIRPPSAPGEAMRVVLDEDASFDELRAALRAALAAEGDQLRGRSARLDLRGRGLELFDLRRLVHLLRDEAGVSVIGLHCTPDALLRYAEQELKLKVHLVDPAAAPVEAPAPDDALLQSAAEDRPTEPGVVTDLTAWSEDPGDAFLYGHDEAPGWSSLPQAPSEEGGRRVLVVEKTLRSGRNVRFQGDVVVFGDVNPGAEIEAGGHILVLGSLRGLAHAGVEMGPTAPADERALIVAFDLRPAQLRIGRRIAMLGDRPERGARGLTHPEVAFVRDGELRVEDYLGKPPLH